MPADQLFEMLKKFKEEDIKTGRFHPVSSKFSNQRYRNADCQRYDQSGEDRGVPHYEGSVFILEIHGLTCIHPDFQTAFIDIQYSQRRLASEQPTDITAEGEAFIQSLEFTPLVRPFVSNSIEVKSNPQIVASGHGSLWVTLMRENAVARIAPEGRAIVATIKVGDGPVGIAVTDTAVWVANSKSDTVSRIDPGSNAVIATVGVGPKPLLMAAAFGSVWVTNSGGETISRIDPNTNTVTATVTVGKHPSGVTAAGKSVWVTNFGDGTVHRINPVTNQKEGRPIAVGRGPNFVAGDNDSVWVVNQNDGTVYRIDSATNAIMTRVSLGSTLGGLSIGHGFVWVADAQRGDLFRIDPKQGEKVDPAIHVGLHLLGVATTQDAIFVVDQGGLLMRVEP